MEGASSAGVPTISVVDTDGKAMIYSESDQTTDEKTYQAVWTKDNIPESVHIPAGLPNSGVIRKALKDRATTFALLSVRERALPACVKTSRSAMQITTFWCPSAASDAEGDETDRRFLDKVKDGMTQLPSCYSRRGVGLPTLAELRWINERCKGGKIRREPSLSPWERERLDELSKSVKGDGCEDDILPVDWRTRCMLVMSYQTYKTNWKIATTQCLIKRDDTTLAVSAIDTKTAKQSRRYGDASGGTADQDTGNGVTGLGAMKLE